MERAVHGRDGRPSAAMDAVTPRGVRACIVLTTRMRACVRTALVANQGWAERHWRAAGLVEEAAETDLADYNAFTALNSSSEDELVSGGEDDHSEEAAHWCLHA